MRSWRRLGELIHAEAARRGSLRELAAAAGVGLRTLESLAGAERDNYRQHTIDRLEAAMGWEHGSVQRVLEGREPIPLRDPMLERLLDAWPALTQRDRRIVLALVEAMQKR